MSECPVQAPKLITAKSTVVTCGSCGAWAWRYPSFFGEDDGYWQCDKCGNTSIRERDGRPYSNKSRIWGNIAKSFADMWTDIPEWDWDTVETDPPMKEIDWSAIEAWYRSQGIYRVFLYAPHIEIEEVEPNHFQVTVNP
jgi:hypothetical protein